MEPTSTATDLIEDELALRSGDGTSLHVRRMRPREGVRARLLVVHGFAEHGGRYGHVLRWFAGRGYETAVLDLRGHGRSGGRRTYISRFGDYVADAEAFLRALAPGPPAVPSVALAHSMGGLVLLRTLQTRGDLLPALRGAAISSPFLALGAKIPAWKSIMGKGLSRVIPTFRMPTEVHPEHLARDPAVGAAYMADPLVVKSATARWFTEVLAAQREVFAEASRVRVPVLLQHGTEDPLVDPTGTSRFHEQLTVERDLRMWPGLRHELFNELEKEQVLAHVQGWFDGRLA